MTKVFVHGNPETAAIWGPLIGVLAEWDITDVVTLSPPGFGAPVPDGFSPTPAGYVDWLASALADIGGPIDLVGHDWGAGHVFGLAADHPHLIRSWACDVAGLLHPDYVWHDMAQTWQTPGAGEEAIAAMLAVSTTDRAALYEGLGMTPEIAASVAAAADEAMGRCILELYRAAVPPALSQLADRLAAAERRPGLFLNAEADAYVPAALAIEPAQRLGAQVVALPGQGHWWMIENPTPAGDALARFWNGLG